MPRHFLVKRHKHCPSSFSYRDRAPQQQQQNGMDTFPGTTTTIIDTDKHLIIRDGDAVSEYGAYGSPDSGYAASPNSGHLGFVREKENILGLEREIKNSSSGGKAAAPKLTGYANRCDGPGQRAVHSSVMMEKSGHVDNMEDDVLDTPIDLSMPSRKKSAASPPPVTKYRESPTCFQRPYLTYRHLEPPPLSPHNPVQVTLASAPVMYFNTFNKVYLGESAEKPLAARISPLSPSINAYNYPLSCPDPWVSSMYPPLYGCSITSDPPEDTPVTSAYGDQRSRHHSHSGHITTLSQPLLLPKPAMSGKRTPTTDQKPQQTQSPTPQQQAAATIFKTGNDLSARPATHEAASPLNSPSRKRLISEDSDETNTDPQIKDLSKSAPPMKTGSSGLSASMTTPKVKDAGQQASKTAAPPKKPNSSAHTGKRLKAVRRLNFDIDTTSPVSGTIIKDAADFHPEDGKVVYGDIEPSFNFVEVTPEARAELEKIDNKIGDYICQLCKEFYEDAFQLAQHRCSRIIHVEYRCPECEKVFNCPANLASHRRWHKPRASGPTTKLSSSNPSKLLSSNPRIAPRPDSNADKSMLASLAPTPPPSDQTHLNGLSGLSVQPCGDVFIKSAPASDHEGTSDDSQSSGIPRKYHEHASHTEPDTLKPPFRYLASIKSEAANSSLAAASDGNSSNFKTIGEFESEAASNNPRRSPPTSESVSAPSRNNTVIATNPLHPTTFGSSLTPEERSLVLQVLSTHNRQYQTTTITSTSTVMTPLVTDSRCQPEQPIKTLDQLLPKENQKISNDPVLCLGAQNECAKYLDVYKSSSPMNLIPTKDPCGNRNKPNNAAPSQNTTNVECALCGKKFQRHAYLRKHIQTQHSGNPKKTFEKHHDYIALKDNGMKSDHVTMKHGGHQGQGQDTFGCAVCGKGFSSDTSRLKHETSCHGLPPNLACSTCGMSFGSKCALDKHVRSTHVTETFSCKYCTSMFHSSPGLTRHINKCHPTENRQVILLQLPASRTF